MHYLDQNVETVLNNQLRIPSGPVFCPVSGCEVGVMKEFHISMGLVRSQWHPFLCYDVIIK